MDSYFSPRTPYSAGPRRPSFQPGELDDPIPTAAIASPGREAGDSYFAVAGSSSAGYHSSVADGQAPVTAEASQRLGGRMTSAVTVAEDSKEQQSTSPIHDAKHQEQQGKMQHIIGAPTANPFKLSNAHPTAFPIQNGATAAFQQALLNRQGSSALSGWSSSAVPQTPGVFGAVSSAKDFKLTVTPSAYPQPATTASSSSATLATKASASSSQPLQSSPSRQKRHGGPNHVSVSGKAVRTPVMASPRRESISPPESPEDQQHHQQAGRFMFNDNNTRSTSQTVPQTPSVDPFAAAASFFSGSSNVLSSSSLLPTARGGVAGLPAHYTQQSGAAPLGKSTSLPLSGAVAGGKLRLANASATAAGVRRGSAVQNARFRMMTIPTELMPFLTKSSKERSLILDLRPHSAFIAQGRIKQSINICVPSTLLRRPNFSLAKIAETIPFKKDRTFFETSVDIQDGNATCAKRILLLDQESNMLATDGVLHSLLGKLERSGFKDELWWLKGGWSGVAKWVEEHHDDDGDEEVVNPSGPKTLATRDLYEKYIDMSELWETESEGDDDGDDEETMGGEDTVMEVQSSQLRSALQGDSSSSVSLPASSASPFAQLAKPQFQGRTSDSSISSSTGDSGAFFASSAGSSSLGGYSTSQTSLSSSGGGFDSSKLSLPNMKKKGSPAVSPQISISSTVHSRGASGSATEAGGKGSSTPIIRPRNLPMSAFQFGSTAAGSGNGSDSGGDSAGSGPRSAISKTLSMNLEGVSPTTAFGSRSAGLKKEKSASFTNIAKLDTRLAVAGKGKMAANPFFDNIRQNMESASLEVCLAHISDMHIPAKYTSPSLQPHLPAFLRELIALEPRARAEKLHREYFEIEQNEQKRLQKVLDWHCNVQSTCTVIQDDSLAMKDNKKRKTDKDDDNYHPFSISAGVEKGQLNRYKNMWPYEHARVRLTEKQNSPTSGDYINASHIRLRGTEKAYIASQGPLESTTEHFWELVLQEKVTVIVMLTLLHEGGRDKCSNYFKSAEWGDIVVTMKEEKGDSEVCKKAVAGMEDGGGLFAGASGGFSFFESSQQKQSLPTHASHPSSSLQSGQESGGQVATEQLDSTTVRRTLEIRRKSTPGTPPHVVHHIQYIAWPDFDIPPDEHVVLALLEETNSSLRKSQVPDAPVLVHCSAGVGRTGTFIAVDTLMDRYRKERSEKREKAGRQTESRMDLDEPAAARLTNSQSPTTRHRRSGSTASNSDAIGAMTLDETSPSPVSGEPEGRSSTNKGKPRPPPMRHLPSSDTIIASSRQPSPGPFTSMSSDGESECTTGEKGETAKLIGKLEQKALIPQDVAEPVFSLVDQMREQRMSSVANAGQYVFTHLALLAGIVADLKSEGVEGVQQTA